MLTASFVRGFGGVRRGMRGWGRVDEFVPSVLSAFVPSVSICRMSAYWCSETSQNSVSSHATWKILVTLALCIMFNGFSRKEKAHCQLALKC